MRRLPPCLAVLLLAVSLLVGVAAAQDRRAHPGRVLDAGGKPVPGAEVTLLFAPPFGPELGVTDVVRKKSDAEGRFRAELLTGACYVAWAATEEHQSGVVDVDPARQCELRLDAEVRSRRSRIDGLDAWADAGPFTLRIEIDGVPGLCPDLRVAAGRVELPLLPADRMDGVLLDKNGVAVWRILGFRTGDGESVPPPRTIPVHVVDDAGKPVAGALLQQIWHRSMTDELGRFASHTGLVRSGVTDAEGRAQLRVACAKDPFDAGSDWLDLHFLASQDGCDGSICGFTDGLYLDGKKADAEQQARKQFEFVLRKAKPFAGRATGTPAALPGSIVVRAMARAGLDVNHWCELPFAVCVPVDKEGRFALPPLPAGATVLDALVAPPPLVLAADDPFRRSCARSPVALPVGVDVGVRELLLDLAQLRVLRVQVSGAAGEPVCGASVLLALVKDNSIAIDEAPSVGRTDLLGRLACSVPPGSWFVFVADGNGWTHRLVEIGSADGRADGRAEAFALQPFARMPLRVVDADGKPVAGARAQVRETSCVGGSPPEQQAVMNLSNTLSDKMLSGPVSDADGRLVLRFLPAKQMTMRFVVEQEAGETTRTSPMMLLEEAGVPIEVRLR